MNWTSITLDDLLPTLIIFVILGIAWLWRHELEKRRQIEKQLSEKKYDTYIDFINIYFELFRKTKQNKKIEIHKYGDRLLNIQKNLIIFGSDLVNEKFFHWKNYSEDKKNIKYLTNVIIEMRRDMGNPKTKITSDKFLRSLLLSEADYKNLKNDDLI